MHLMLLNITNGLTGRATANEGPSEELLASLEEIEDIKVDKLVGEYLSAQTQSLKILPQAPFGDAVNQFVDKDDKHAMESFVSDSLSEQVKQMLKLDDREDDDLETIMEMVKERLEKQFATGALKQAKRRRYKPKPDDWDSDLDGHWEDSPQAIDDSPTTTEAKAQTTQPKGRGRKATNVVEDEDEDEDMDDVEEQPVPKARGRGRPSTAKPKATPAKAPAKKAPAKGRGRKAQIFEQSDEEEEDDVVMDDDDYDPPAPPPQKHTTTRATTSRAAPSRSQTSRATPTTTSKAAPKTTKKQTTLNFSQRATQDDPLEISDDEISDDFESVPETRTRRR